MIPLIQDWHRIALKEVVYQAEQESWSNFNDELVAAEEGLRKKESRLPVSEKNFPEKSLTSQFKSTTADTHKPEIHEMRFVFQNQESPVQTTTPSKSLIGQVVSPFLTSSQPRVVEDASSDTLMRLVENQKLIQKQIVLDEKQFESWLQEVVTAARYIQKGEMKHLAFQLSPKDLGDLDIFISEEDGSLAVHIFAEAKATQEKLKKQLPDLLAKLESFYSQNLKVKILQKPSSALYEKLTQVQEEIHE